MQQLLDNIISVTELDAQLQMAHWAEWMFWATIGSMALSAGALGGLLYSLKQTRNSIAQNRQTGMLERRPWLSVTSAKVVGAWSDKVDGILLYHAKLHIAIENTGLSPAIHVNYGAALLIDDGHVARELMDKLEVDRPIGPHNFAPHTTESKLHAVKIRPQPGNPNSPAFVEIHVRYSGPEGSERHETCVSIPLYFGDKPFKRSDMERNWHNAAASEMHHITIT